MKNSSFFLVLFFFYSLIFAQSESLIGNKQLMPSIYGVGSTEVVTQYINAVGKVWESNSTTFVISTDNELYNNSIQTTGNANLTNHDWIGFNWKWVPGTSEVWGCGLYKISNSKVSGKYV